MSFPFHIDDAPLLSHQLEQPRRRVATPDRQGRDWEKEFGQAVRCTDAWFTDSNDRKAVNDCRFTYLGHSFLGEMKKTESATLALSVVSKAQVGYLDAHVAAGGTSFLAIKRVLPGWQARVFCVNWMVAKRLGRRTIQLDNPPPELIEIFEMERPHGLGTAWDLQPFIDASFTAYLQRLEIFRQ